MNMKFGSLFTGVGGFDLGFERAGMTCAWQCEIDKHAIEVLEQHWPEVKRYDDVRELGKGNAEPTDIICGGFPCQDLSIAGKREGLAGERSGLWWEFARIIDELEPKWVVAENVPGLLSSNGGRDFALILQWLVKRGFGVCWRILDSKYVGVAQRRRRVFIVASFGNGRCAEVLFERESVPGNTKTRRKEGEEVADTTVSSIEQRGYKGINADNLDHMIPKTFTIRSGKEGGGKGYLEASSPMTLGGQPQYLQTLQMLGGQHPNASITEGISPTIPSAAGSGGGHTPIVAYNISQQDDGRNNGEGGLSVEETDVSVGISSKSKTVVMAHGQANAEILEDQSPTLSINHEAPIAFQRSQLRLQGNLDMLDVSPTLKVQTKSGDTEVNVWQMNHASEAYRDCGTQSPTLQERMGTGGNNVPLVGVRRLTPTECERLQGFPDGWTDGQSDTQRYKQMGNAVTVNVIEWIGKRIMEVENKTP